MDKEIDPYFKLIDLEKVIFEAQNALETCVDCIGCQLDGTRWEEDDIHVALVQGYRAIVQCKEILGGSLMISMKFLNGDLTFRVGKHKDKHISDVDRFYLDWCLNEGRESMKPIEVDIFKAFIKHKKDYAEKAESQKAQQKPEAAVVTQATGASLLADADDDELPF